MKTRKINASEVQQPSGGYSQAFEVTHSDRQLFISGQIPVDLDGDVPQSFEDQALLAWRNIEAQLNAADMKLSDIVKHTTFLADRKYCDANSKIRNRVLKDHHPALTVVIATIYDEAWLLEIEAIAMV